MEYIKIKKEDFNKAYKMAENIFYMIKLIRLYCMDNQDIEEISTIIPVLNYAYHESDNIYAGFINFEGYLESLKAN